MKSLNKYITEGLRIGINKCIPIMSESLRIGINDNPYTASPTTFDELRQIIEQRFEELGPGTEQEPIDFNDIDVSNIDSFFNVHGNIGIFAGTKFEYIDVSNWNVSKVEDMSCMFEYCKNLKSVGDISKWNVSKVEIMSWMFSYCEKLKSVGNINRWNVSNVKYMESMFNKSGIINIPSWYKE